MSKIRITLALLFLLLSLNNYAQLGFCLGSKGEPIFTENFGNGTTYGPALPAGITSYTFVNGAPNDGQYTLYYRSNLYSTWHYSLDHTPDATDGPNGKMLNVNANAVTSGDFYRKVVSGLCVNTTFEFSAWVMNVYNPGSGFCGANEIPINVRFEIWNAAETILLGSGNTGNILGTSSPIWQQFALVFTTVSETSVVLKMKNNGLGGCGNDLAIDDISFSACGDLTTVSSSSGTGSSYVTCNNPASLTLNATTGGLPYFYQWQSSADGVNWVDIAGQNSPAYNASGITSLTYYRVKAAQDLANLSNSFCSTASNVFTVSILPGPAAAISNGNQTICSNATIPALSVNVPAGTNVNWYDAATAGTLLQANSALYTPTAAGTYYAETYTASSCTGSPRTAVTLTIVTLPNATISGTTSICSGSTTIISFSGTPNAIVTYTINGGINQTLPLDASGAASLTTPSLASNTTYALVSVASASLSSCSRALNIDAVITVNASLTANVSSNSPVCSGNSATLNFTGTPNAVITYAAAGGSDQTVTLSNLGIASVAINNVTSTTVYTLTKVAMSGACTQILFLPITITAVPLPTASITASPIVLCANQNSMVNFSGTPNAIVTYKVNNGTNQTITLNASGMASISTVALTSNTTYTLVSCTSPSLSTCTTMINSSIIIAVQSAPTAAISTVSPIVCYGTPATVNFSGTPNAAITYAVNAGTNQTIVLNALGNASVIVPNVTSTLLYSVSAVTAAGATGCTAALSQSINIQAVPLLTATITANPANPCSNQTSTINFTGTPNAVIAYTVNGSGSQFITLSGLGLAAVTAQVAVNTTYQLSNITMPGTTCSKVLSDSVVISVTPAPSVIYNGNTDYCEGEPIAILLSSNIAGTTFSWTVAQNGTSGATPGNGNQIAQNLTLLTQATATATYTVTPFFNGCAGNPVPITITIHPVPIPEITDGVICTSGSGQTAGQPYILNTNLSAANHSFEWFFNGNAIPNAIGNTYQATQIGLYTVIATNNAGCVSAPVDAVVGEMSQGESLVIQQSAAFSDDPTATIIVIGGDGPFMYQVDHGAFQSSNIFNNLMAGTHTLTVVDAFCTNLTGTFLVLDYPKYFTPNGDGIHDTWNVRGINDAVIRIFDRYGKLLKQISPEGLGWDGTYNGRLLPSTDYWFTINYFEKGVSKIFKAHFTLKR